MSLKDLFEYIKENYSFQNLRIKTYPNDETSIAFEDKKMEYVIFGPEDDWCLTEFDKITSSLQGGGFSTDRLIERLSERQKGKIKEYELFKL